jgi:hypothetical protein
MVLITTIKLWLVDAQDFIATYTPADDYLFIKLAKNILSGTWLGPYDHYTLVKGPIYPLFIAVTHHTGIPLLLAQHLLYSAICILAVVALRPLLKNQWFLVCIFFLLLFNPFTYSYPGTGRAFRFGLSVPLVLGLFSCMGGLLLRVDSTLKIKLSWSIAIGVIFSLLWYTREEGVWLLPSMLLFGIYFLFIGDSINLKKIATKTLLLLPIPFFFFCFTGALFQLNQKYYGPPCINELKSPEFQSALGGLMNIDVVKNERYIPVDRKNLHAAYEISPTFRKLRPYFEQAEKKSQLPPSFFIWTLRTIVQKSGNANSLPEALDFYKKVGAEINAACEAGNIACLDRKPSIKPVWRAEYIRLIPENFWDILKQAITFREFTLQNDEYSKWTTNAKKEMVPDYLFVTREKLVPGYKHHLQAYPEYYMHMIKEKFRVMADIGTGYKALVPYLFTLALLMHLFFLGRSFKRRQFDFASIFGLVILGGIISLVSILTYVKITLWPINRPLFAAYPLVLYYISTIFILVTHSITRARQIEQKPESV